ncbi:hypothetical protein QYM36_009838 [Artemia franciscana]|uniref:Uncharacterized protein n=1 Tax=Artemia franciscana TaxID=6661 RepID=A0AA88HSJ8_ARTSF|nr:hypothetical protein QYM36_009837 [Artemia franciscana]KAK2714980.1 hypothetical protein QYM36_009838 [Artemia franciscana]
MKERFEDFVQRNISKERNLLNRIDSLERYPSQNPVGNAETGYKEEEEAGIRKYDSGYTFDRRMGNYDYVLRLHLQEECS